MADAKIQITVGAITFSGEGAQDWVEKQLDKVLRLAPDLLKLAPDTPGESKENPAKPPRSSDGSGTLASFLTRKTATTNQVKKFLATAEWLHIKGQKKLATNDVTKALSDSHQKKLTNPAQCLNSNVTKGHCEKDGSSFFVTPEGRTFLG